tara:strand:- start:3005 stop:3754 length:750 start_codon:yes stop_codon:yes gene_type:complete
MSAISYDIPYNARVRAMTASQLKRKIASQPQLEHYEIPSVHRSQSKMLFKDRTKVIPELSQMSGGMMRVLSDGSADQNMMGLGMCGGAMCQNCMKGGRDTSSGGGRDTSSGGKMRKMGGKMIGLPKPRNIKGEGFFGDLKRDLTHPKATLKGLSKGKTYVEALKKTGQILEGALPYGAAAMAGLETGSPAAAIGAFKGTKSQIKEAKELAGSGAGDKRKQRGLLVSKMMKKHGVSLAEASRMIKKEGLM